LPRRQLLAVADAVRDEVRRPRRYEWRGGAVVVRSRTVELTLDGPGAADRSGGHD
jgi:hypothetical protein